MRDVKDSPRAHVRIGYDGKVFKTYRGRLAEERFHTELTLLRYLERRGCDFTPRVLDFNEEELLLVMSNCGQPVKTLTQKKMDDLFEELEAYGVRHGDQAARNVTYDANRGRFCIIDFEFARLVDNKEAPNKRTWTTLHWSGVTDQGPFRKRNDDTFQVFMVDQRGFQQLPDAGEANIDDGDIVFLVSDGMGGATSGDLASQLISGRLREVIPQMYQQASNQYPDRLATLEECFQEVHDKVNALGDKNPHLKGMGATMTLCWFTPENAYFCHIGDTRLYQFRETKLTQLTRDHTRVWEAFHRGELNERECRTHPRGSVLKQAIGAGLQTMEPQLGAEPPNRNDWYLLCSDGLIGGLWHKHLLSAFEGININTTPSSLTEALLKQSLENDGRDNVSLVTLQVV
jgi:serine/threonine protein phosphatase PrpC